MFWYSVLRIWSRNSIKLCLVKSQNRNRNTAGILILKWYLLFQGARVVQPHRGVRLPDGAVCGHPPGQPGREVQHGGRHAQEAAHLCAEEVRGGGRRQPHDA